METKEQEAKPKKSIFLEGNYKCLTLANHDDSKTLKQHIFIPKICKTPIIREEYKGNISLCGKFWASDDGELASDWKQLENERLNDENICKICFKKLTHPKL